MRKGTVHRRGTWHDKRRAVYTLETNAATAGMAQGFPCGNPDGVGSPVWKACRTWYGRVPSFARPLFPRLTMAAESLWGSAAVQPLIQTSRSRLRSSLGFFVTWAADLRGFIYVPRLGVGYILNPISTTWLRDTLYTCDGISAIWYFPLLFKIGNANVTILYKVSSNSIFLYF